MSGKDGSQEGKLVTLFLSELERGEMLFSMLEEVIEGHLDDDLGRSLLYLKYKDIPYEMCSYIKQLERLEELEQVICDIESAITLAVSDAAVYAEWVEDYPELSDYKK